MSAFWPHTRSKTLYTPLVSCIDNDALVLEVVPSVQQTLLQFVNAVLCSCKLQLMHSLLDVAPYLAIDRIEIGAIRRPQIWRSEC